MDEQMIEDMQDFRDVEGDILEGRRTLPIIHGYKGRIWVAAAIAVCALCMPFLLLLNSSPLAVGVVGVIFAYHVMLAVRVLQEKGAAEDDWTYKLLDGLYMLVWGSSALWLQAPM